MVEFDSVFDKPPVYDIAPISVNYDGHQFKSKLEARYAVLWNELEIAYQYEPRLFRFPIVFKGKVTMCEEAKYLPDFYLPERGLWIEVKGSWSQVVPYNTYRWVGLVECTGQPLWVPIGSPNDDESYLTYHQCRGIGKHQCTVESVYWSHFGMSNLFDVDLSVLSEAVGDARRYTFEDEDDDF